MDSGIIAAAFVAAAGTLANTWLNIRHDSKVKDLRSEIKELRRLTKAKRKATRTEDNETIVVIDPEEIGQMVQEMENGSNK